MPSLSLAFRIIVFARFTAAMYTGISDCDEGEWHMPRTAESVGRQQGSGQPSLGR